MQGELSAQLTEGFRHSLWLCLAEGELPGFAHIWGGISAFRGAMNFTALSRKTPLPPLRRFPFPVEEG